MFITAFRVRSCVAIVCAAFLLAIGATPHLLRSADASAPAVPTKVNPRLGDVSGDVRVYVGLASNNLASDLARRQADQLARQQRATAHAQSLAAANPYLLTEQERRAARRIESLRNWGLRAIRKAAEPDAAANERVAALIRRGGGEIHQSSPLPNSITATVPARLIPVIAHNSLVKSITPAGGAPLLMNSPVDGSETWHANGFTGNGSSADGNGGPDFGVIDAGVRTTHLAFRSRLPGDPGNGPATGPSRITSPLGRTFFGGSEHGNTVASTVANTDLTQPVWPYHKGLAYGIDKVFDPYQAQSGFYWLTGIEYANEPGVDDLPEALNYSSGIYEDTTDFNPVWIFIDDHIASFGITYSISGGNCGVEGGGFTGCSVMGQGPHRVSTPGNLHNTITVGGLDYNGDIYDPDVWISWANSSPGPTWGGRKKPDLIADTYGGSTPSQLSDTIYENAGQGTSFAAPQASAGALLLASTGVYQPTAQKAILVNAATPIQNQTYWTPKSGWGALNLDSAFHQRANYANGTITGSADNGVRLFRVSGVTSADRSTLVWNRRTATATTYHPLTDLDLSQHNESTGATTSTGGSDAADTVDTNQVVDANNPMPGSGTDGGDNVEQIRSTGSGTQVLKVKALTGVTGIAAEPFSIASAHPITALDTPAPTVDLSADLGAAQPSETVTLTAQVENPSDDVDLTSAEVTLALPSGVNLTSGTLTQNVTLTSGSSDTAIWQVEGSSEGLKNLTASVEGTAYGELFSSEDTTGFTVDGTAPTAAVSGPSTWATTADVPFNWSGTDSVGIASYDVEISRNGSAFGPLLLGTTSESTIVQGTEGESLTVRVVAKDTAGNTSAPATHSATVDAIPPQISLTPALERRGTAAFDVAISNVGSLVTASYFFGVGDGAQVPLLGSRVTFTNTSPAPKTATARVTATDGVGRVVVASAAVRVESSLPFPSLKITSAKGAAGRLVVKGGASKSASGRVSLAIKRIGTVGTRRKTVRVRLVRGRFATKVKLAPGRYLVTASLPRSTGFLAQKTSVRVRVK